MSITTERRKELFCNTRTKRVSSRVEVTLGTFIEAMIEKLSSILLTRSNQQLEVFRVGKLPSGSTVVVRIVQRQDIPDAAIFGFAETLRLYRQGVDPEGSRRIHPQRQEIS